MWIKNHKNTKSKSKKPNKYLQNLTDKKMLKKMKLYDNLTERHAELQKKITSLQTVDTDINSLMDNINDFSKIIKKELYKLEILYKKTNYRDFISKTSTFLKLLPIYRNYIQKLEFALADKNKILPLNNNNQR